MELFRYSRLLGNRTHALGGGASPRRANRLAWVVVASLIGPTAVSAATISVGPGKTLSEAIAAAGSGDLIVLPAGTFPGGIRLPDGVGLRGAGYLATTLEARAVEVGLTIAGGEGAEIADLSIAGARKTNLLVRDASHVAIRRVRSTGGIHGVYFADVVDGRIENVISAGNRYGIQVNGGRGNSVVNCTLADNTNIGLSLASGVGPSAFNNCIVGGATGVFVGEKVEGLRLDHNLYFSLFVGKMAGQVGRRSLGDWTYLSGLDPHSVQLPVTFRDPKAGDYRPKGSLRWSFERAATSDWGTSDLGGIKPPDRDIDDQPRVGRFDVGVCEVSLTPPRPADGVLEVHSGDGLKSAGIFGRRHVVDYLFHNLPLPEGKYPYWLPARDFLGGRIAAGTYELRAVEAAHHWQYLGWVGDTGAAYPPGHTASVGLSSVAFDDHGHLLAGQGWSEDTTNVRGYEASTGKIVWTFGGSSNMNGFALGSDGVLSILRPSDTKKVELTRIDPKSGKVAPLDGAGTGRVVLDLADDVVGLAELDGKIFVTDTKANKVRFGPADGSRWDGAIDVPSPSSPAADRKTRVVWVISEGKGVLAIAPDGRVVSNRDFSGFEPAALAAGEGRLAVATRADGRVHIADVPDPTAKVKSERTLGRGDGPFGPYLADRFLFQRAQGSPAGPVRLALGPKGELAVVDQNRLLVFDQNDNHLWSTFGLFGGFTAPSFAEPRRVYDGDGRRSLLLDIDEDGAGTWQPGGYFDLPVTGRLLGDFADGGKTYGLFLVETPSKPGASLLLVRYEGYRAVPVFAIIHDPQSGLYASRRDTNRDGKIDARDGAEVVKGPDGKPYAGLLTARFNYLQPNGDLLICGLEPDRWATLWHRSHAGDGTPNYRIEHREKLPRTGGGLISPYTHKLDPTDGFLSAAITPTGDVIANIFLRSSPDGVGLSNTAGTDLASFDRRGQLRWIHRLDTDRGIVGLSAAGPVAITGVGTTAEILVFDQNGLGLGSFGQPAKVRYPGFFLDHPDAVRAYQGADDRTYALIADNFNGRHHWYRLDGADQIKSSSTPVTVGARTAGLLAAMPIPPPYVPSRPAPTTVRIPKLSRALPIDGDLAKWRAARIAPQIVITPETAGGGIDGPEDCSAVVRLAHHGDDLYAQFLVFDDVVSFHQNVNKRFKQDSVEMCINGFMTGFKFESTFTTDVGPLVFRNRYYFSKFDWAMPADLAPRSIKVLDNARDVRERELVESVYGVDMSNCRVIVVEFKLPINAATYKDSPKELKELTPWSSGREFWLGFLINDNDDPGTDVQNFLVWPATYGNFSPAEEGARAVLE
jgi:hypothetical protein